MSFGQMSFGQKSIGPIPSPNLAPTTSNDGNIIGLANWHFGQLAFWPTGILANWHFGQLAFWPTGILATDMSAK